MRKELNLAAVAAVFHICCRYFSPVRFKCRFVPNSLMFLKIVLNEKPWQLREEYVELVIDAGKSDVCVFFHGLSYQGYNSILILNFLMYLAY